MKRTAALATALLATAPLGAHDVQKVDPLERSALQPDRAVCRGSDGYADAFGGRRLFLYRPEWLEAQRPLLAGAAGSKRLRRDADAALARPIATPAAKTRTPPSGDKRDYMSMGPYWWPDTARRNGEPYVRRDGRVNPERDGDGFDLQRLETFSKDVEALAIAYHHLGDRRYADKAASLVRAWFVDPLTRMNPNLNFAQSVPGRSAGRAEGVIDAERLLAVVEAIGLLAPSVTLSEADQAATEAWFGEMVQWMATSAIGRAERAKTNNHGVIYDLMLIEFALFARLDDVARHVVGEFGDRRIAAQMADDGALPEELKRTRSWHYAHLAAGGMVQVAQLGECLGVDLWRWKSGDGRSIEAALRYLSPYQGKLDSWPRKDIDLSDPARRAAAARTGQKLFRLAAWGMGDKTYGELAERAAADTISGVNIWPTAYDRN